MMIQRFLALILALMLVPAAGVAQELLVSMKVNTPKLQTTDPKVFQDFKLAVETFMNSQRWTDQSFENFEKIKISIQLNITEELSDNTFRGDFQILATRPIYGTDQESVLLSHQDRDFLFSYQPLDPMQYVKGQFQSNLISFLSFYANLVIGLDGDSFSPYGGEDALQIAQTIVNTIPQPVAESAKGWRPQDGQRNRYWIMENILSPRLRNFRKAYYDYHRQGIDVLSSNPEGGKAIMTAALESILETSRAYPTAMAWQLFANSKYTEVIEIFKEGTARQKLKVKEVMSRLDPANATRYQVLR